MLMRGVKEGALTYEEREGVLRVQTKGRCVLTLWDVGKSCGYGGCVMKDGCER